MIKERDYLKWIVKKTLKAIDRPCAINSPDPNAIEAAL